jgi:hypothetical protein
VLTNLRYIFYSCQNKRHKWQSLIRIKKVSNALVSRRLRIRLSALPQIPRPVRRVGHPNLHDLPHVGDALPHVRQGASPVDDGGGQILNGTGGALPQRRRPLPDRRCNLLSVPPGAVRQRLGGGRQRRSRVLHVLRDRGAHVAEIGQTSGSLQHVFHCDFATDQNFERVAIWL